MKRKIITISEQESVYLPSNGNVWMAEYEIADLFQVFYSAITANRKAIFKSGVLRKEDVCREIKTSKGYIEEYNLEMIIALAFRIKSYRTVIFRRWLIRKLSKAEIPEMLIMAIQNPILN